MLNWLDSHFQRIEDGANSVFTLQNLSKWIVKHTKHEGKPFSYRKHPYQPAIIDDPSKTSVVVKCAQTGLSEIFARWAMAACSTQNNFTLIWTFPSSTDAEDFSKARLAPIIEGSAEIQRMLSKINNSVSLKQFGQNSFAYVRGTISDTAGLSVPADLLIHDEYDKSDTDNISKYVSRLQAKETKMRRLFSTPTVAKYGISAMADNASRKREVWKCSHCNHNWLPSYELDVKIPGYDGPKKEINAQNLKGIRWSEAKLLCPHCGKEPSVDVQFREWVVENPIDNYDTSAWFITPFSAPLVITPSYLVKVSTEFKKWSEFVNQALGLVAEDDEEMLTESDIRRCLIAAPLDSTEVHYMGCDMGLMCHIVIGRRAHDGKFLVVHREKVYFTKFEERRRELIRTYRVLVSVHDVYPYTDIVKRITDYDPNAYGALYVTKASTELYTVRDKEAEEAEGKLNVRQVNINRSVTLDSLMYEFKAGTIVLPEGEDTEVLVASLLDMKRIQKFDKHGGIMYMWEKTEGNDHYHHALVYCMTAASLRGTGTARTDLSQLGLIRTMKVKW